jgi:hypothetical protein
MLLLVMGGGCSSRQECNGNQLDQHISSCDRVLEREDQCIFGLCGSSNCSFGFESTNKDLINTIT